MTTEFLQEIDLTQVYEGHNPSQDPRDCELTDGLIMVIRSPIPNEESSGGVFIPVPDGEDGYTYQPNCGRVVAVSPNMKRSVTKDVLGKYIFWVMNSRPSEEAHLKPQPLVLNWTNTAPHLWTLHEDYVLFTLPHGGDPAWIDVKENVISLDTRGEWNEMSANWVGEGTIFKDADGKVWQALFGRKKDSDENTTAVYAVPRMDLGA